MSKAEEKAAKVAAKAEEKAAIVASSNGIIVEDPLVLRPKELPLVVKPESGEWANDAQKEYAAVLNAYAYKNTAKWNKKKPVLLAQLADLAENPEKITVLRGEPEVIEDAGRVTFKNNLIQK